MLNILKNAFGVFGAALFVLVWLGLSLLPILVIAHFVLKYW